MSRLKIVVQSTLGVIFIAFIYLIIEDQVFIKQNKSGLLKDYSYILYQMMTGDGRKSPVHVHVDRETPVHVHLKKKKKGKPGVPTAVEVK